MGALGSIRADDWAPNLTTTAAWHSNATLADTTGDQIDSLQLGLDLLSAKSFNYGGADTAVLTGHVAGEWWPRYKGLMSGAAGGRAEWQHKFGPDLRAPVVSIRGTADIVGAKELARRGWLASATFALRKPFSEVTRGTIRHEVSWFDARHAVFDRTAGETTLEFEYDVNERTRITLGARHRDGDIVSYANAPRRDLEALAPNRLELDTFGRLMTAHRIDARTWSTRVALSRAIDDSSALVAAFEWRSSKRGAFSATNNLLSIALVTQF